MIKTLTKHGNSLALVIDRPILDLLKIDANTKLEISTDGTRLFIMPAQENEHKRKFRQVKDEVNQQYGELFKRLAK